MPPVYPLVVVAPEQQRNYRHMAKRDVAVWERFLATHAAPFIGFSYDVALGGTRLQIEDAEEAHLLGWQYSTALKIDAVGWMGNQCWIIEVRPDATTSALGAALCYTLVAKREELTTLPLVPTVVCEAIQPDVQWACEQIGVQVVRV